MTSQLGQAGPDLSLVACQIAAVMQRLWMVPGIALVLPAPGLGSLRFRLLLRRIPLCGGLFWRVLCDECSVKSRLYRK